MKNAKPITIDPWKIALVKHKANKANQFPEPKKVNELAKEWEQMGFFHDPQALAFQDGFNAAMELSKELHQNPS